MNGAAHCLVNENSCGRRPKAAGAALNRDTRLHQSHTDWSNEITVSSASYKSDLRSIASLFSRKVIFDLIDRYDFSRVDCFIGPTSAISAARLGSNVRELFDSAYAKLITDYRSEYVYKNALIQKRLLSRHSLSKAWALSEFPVGSAKADLVILNGTSCAYEIKSELDDFGRLSNQLNQYSSVFEYAYVVTHASCVERALDVVPPHIGLIELTSTYTLRTHREPKSNLPNLSPGLIFDCLRKPEYLDAIRSAYGCVPDVPNTLIRATCRDLFTRLSPSEAHQLMVRVLYQNRRTTADKADICSLPSSLRGLAVTLSLNRRAVRDLGAAIDSCRVLLRLPN